jgi:hypothetical protein
MSPARAAALRRLIRSRAATIGATQEQMCPPRWRTGKDPGDIVGEGGRRKVKRVLEAGAELALEDAFDLVQHLFRSPVGKCRERIFDAARDPKIAAYKAGTRALGLLNDHKVPPPVMRVFVADLELLVEILAANIAETLHVTIPATGGALRRSLRAALGRHEARLEYDDDWARLAAQTSRQVRKEKSIDMLDIADSDDDANPWRGHRA